MFGTSSSEKSFIFLSSRFGFALCYNGCCHEMTQLVHLCLKRLQNELQSRLIMDGLYAENEK